MYNLLICSVPFLLLFNSLFFYSNSHLNNKYYYYYFYNRIKFIDFIFLIILIPIIYKICKYTIFCCKYYYFKRNFNIILNDNNSGIINYKNGNIYNGLIKNILPNGKGTMKYKNGNIYSGFWFEGEKHGEGEMIYSNGNNYKGNWVKDKKHGEGEMIYSNGNNYKGNCVKDKKHDEGKIIHKNNNKSKNRFEIESNVAIYTGNWLNDKKHGKGTLKKKNLEFECNWKDDKECGIGIFTYNDLNQEYYKVKGEFFNGKMLGKTTKYDWNGNVFEGRTDWEGNFILNDCNSIEKINNINNNKFSDNIFLNWLFDMINNVICQLIISFIFILFQKMLRR